MRADRKRNRERAEIPRHATDFAANRRAPPPTLAA